MVLFGGAHPRPVTNPENYCSSVENSVKGFAFILAIMTISQHVCGFTGRNLELESRDRILGCLLQLG